MNGLEKMRMTKLATGPRALPVVHYGTSRYFADLLLRQFRDIENPHNFVDFDSEQGRLMCSQTGIVWCPECRMSMIVSRAFEQKALRCMQCLTVLEPSWNGKGTLHARNER